jgi:hypothetical protein
MLGQCWTRVEVLSSQARGKNQLLRSGLPNDRAHELLLKTKLEVPIEEFWVYYTH